MNQISLIGIAITLLIIIGILYFSTMQGTHYPKNLFFAVKNPQDIAQLFPSSAKELQKRIEIALNDAKQQVDAVIAIPDQEKTFANTVLAFDKIATQSDLAILANAIAMLRMLSTDADVRQTAQKACEQIADFETKELSNNPRMYQAFKTYNEKRAAQENLDKSEKYLLEKIMKQFKHNGLELPDAKQEEIRNLKNELCKLELQFDANIDNDNSCIFVSKDELAGLPDDFINALEKRSDGKYKVGTDYPTLSRVMDTCSVATTRKQLWYAFNNRAYPANEQILKEMAAKRHQLATLLGFDSYAAYSIDDTMANTPDTVKSFLHDIVTNVTAKEQQEFDLFTKELPAGVVLTNNHQLQPWDWIYCKEYYKRNHLQLDEQQIAEYFPMEKTVDGLMKVYEQFFDLKFTKIPAVGLWNDDLSILQIEDRQTQKLMGYLILDLYPRPNKYSHACQETVIPAINIPGQQDNPWVGMIVANFPHSTATQPSLLKRGEVATFFHELGHALHSILGRGRFGTLAGLHVKFDFVEVPSQMFEEWLFDPTVLKTVSSHYKTGEPLSDELINKIIALKNFDAGMITQRQCNLATLSLQTFSNILDDPQALIKELSIAMRPHIAWNDNDHMYASFGHLSGYGAKYYTYLWSKVFALDLASAIKEQGFLNPTVGKKLKESILSKGGTEEPTKLMVDFLNRQPNNKAFLKDITTSF
jgi:thimet oligopeptidase